MKKIRALCLTLALLLLLQCLTQPCLATEGTETAPEASADVTENTELTVPPETIPTVAFGSASITNGCRTIEGMSPLAGTERIADTAQGVFVYEENTETVLYSYNPDTHLYPGSLSKMITALIAIELGNLDDVITVSTREFNTLPVGARNAKLRESEKITLRDLLYLMLLEGHNDAALVIAEYVARVESEFVVLMNRRVEEMGCTNTKLTNCHGLDDPEQYTTARDMTKILMEAMKNELFREIFVAVSYTVPATNKTEEPRALKSLNYLCEETIVPKFNDDRVIGGITSYTNAGGASLACTAEGKDMSLVIVVLGATRTYNKYGNATYYGNFEEVIELLETSFGEYKINQLLYADQALTQFPVPNGDSNVIAHPDVFVNTVLPAEAKMRNLIFKYSVHNGVLSAPITKGDLIGTVQVWYQTSCITEAELYAMNSVAGQENSGLKIYNAATRDDSNMTGVFTAIGIICLVVLALFGVYLAINHLRRLNVRMRRRRRRQSRRRSR